MEFEDIRDEIELLLLRARRRYSVRERLAPHSIFTLRDLGIKAKAEVYNGYDHGGTECEIQRRLDQVKGSVENQWHWKERLANNYITRMMRKGYVGWLRLRRNLGIANDHPILSWWNYQSVNEIMKMINPMGLVDIREGVWSINTPIDMESFIELRGMGKIATALIGREDVSPIQLIGTAEKYCNHYAVTDMQIKYKPTGSSPSTKAGVYMKYAGGGLFKRLFIRDYRYGVYAPPVNIIHGNVFKDSETYYCIEGIILYGSTDNRFNNFYIRDTQGLHTDGRFGFACYGEGGGNVLEAVLVLIGKSRGFGFTDCFGVRMTDCLADGLLGMGYMIYASSPEKGGEITLENCSAGACGFPPPQPPTPIPVCGFWIEGYVGVPEGRGSVRLIAPTASDNGHHGIVIKNSRDVVLIAPATWDNGVNDPATYHGIGLYGARGCQIIGGYSTNYFTSPLAQAYGVFEDAESDYNFIEGINLTAGLGNAVGTIAKGGAHTVVKNLPTVRVESAGVEAIAEGQTEKVVNHGLVGMPHVGEITITPQWQTTYLVYNVTATQFTVAFGTPAPAGGNWFGWRAQLWTPPP